jgi:hypothetical protein
VRRFWGGETALHLRKEAPLDRATVSCYHENNKWAFGDWRRAPRAAKAKFYLVGEVFNHGKNQDDRYS